MRWYIKINYHILAYPLVSELWEKYQVQQATIIINWVQAIRNAINHKIPNAKNQTIFLVFGSQVTCFVYELEDTFSISPIEKTQIAATIHKKKTRIFIKKNMIGTEIILNVLPTNSAAASSIAILTTIVLHMHSIAMK